MSLLAATPLSQVQHKFMCGLQQKTAGILHKKYAQLSYRLEFVQSMILGQRQHPLHIPVKTG